MQPLGRACSNPQRHEGSNGPEEKQSEYETVGRVEEVWFIRTASGDSEGNFRDILPERLPAGKGGVGGGMKALAFSCCLVKRVGNLGYF